MNEFKEHNKVLILLLDYLSRQVKQRLMKLGDLSGISFFADPDYIKDSTRKAINS